MTKKLQYNATITERRDVTESLASFRIAPEHTLSDGDGKRPFLPGQYVTLGLPSERHTDTWIQRPFTISSAPEDPSGIEIYLRKVEAPASDDPFSHLLF